MGCASRRTPSPFRSGGEAPMSRAPVLRGLQFKPAADGPDIGYWPQIAWLKYLIYAESDEPASNRRPDEDRSRRARPGDPSRTPGAEPQPRQLLRRDRTGRVLCSPLLKFLP